MRQSLHRWLEAYETVIPSKRHFVVDKDSGLTSYIERLNITLTVRRLNMEYLCALFLRFTTSVLVAEDENSTASLQRVSGLQQDVSDET